MVLFNSNGRIYDRRVYNNIYKSCLKIPCDVLAPFDVLMFQAMANFHLGWLTKKGPHNTPKYSVFPALLEKHMGLVGAFFGGPIQMENLQQPGLKTAYMQAA